MSNEKHIHYSAADIEKYQKGLLTPKERHALEKAALEDPFLAEAMEGFEHQQQAINITLNELSSRLANRIGKAKVIALHPGKMNGFGWWKIAAMIVLIAGAGLVVYQLAIPKKAFTIAEAKEKTSPDTSSKPQTVETITAQDKTAVITPAETTQKTVAATTKKISPVTNPTISDPKAGMADLFRKDSIKMNKTETALAQREEVLNKEEQKMAAVAAKEKNGYTANRQSYKIYNVFRGRVTDASNNPLPFANITILPDNVGTYSDAKGNFTLTSTDSVLKVQVRSLGYQNSDTHLKTNLATNGIVLHEENNSLSEVVLSKKKTNSNRSRQNNMVLEEPEPADGWSNYDIYLDNNLNIPETYASRETGAGEVLLSFEVNKIGDPVNIKVEKSLCETCDKEAIRLVQQGPKWKPNKKKKRTSVAISF